MRLRVEPKSMSRASGTLHPNFISGHALLLPGTESLFNPAGASRRQPAGPIHALFIKGLRRKEEIAARGVGASELPHR